MTPDSGNTLLERYNSRAFQGFLRDDSPTLTVAAPSLSPFHAASTHAIHYTKERFGPELGHHLKCIKKDGETHSWVWLTDEKKLKEGIRWGIVRPDSLTGQVIATLGEYRLEVHHRVTKGMMTKTQSLKLKLLDSTQARLDLLAPLESLVNCDHDVDHYRDSFNHYLNQLDASIEKLAKLRDTSLETILPGRIKLLTEELVNAKERAKAYLKTLLSLPSLQPVQQARGELSILEFVKQESTQLLYELQGLNQDLTFSRARSFALTRGELNDAIEDARKVIDDHRADPKNRITPKHHQHYEAGSPIAFHFDPKQYSPDQERKALMAVSFIEGWDEFLPETHQARNEKKQTAKLDIITATHWQRHRNFTASIKSFGYFIFNMIKGFIKPTQPWNEEAWDNPDFHLYYSTLLPHCRYNQHIWWKVFHFFIKLGKVFYDFIEGIRDFTSKLVISLPKELVNDWYSTQQKNALEQMYTECNEEISTLKKLEKKRLKTILKSWTIKTRIRLSRRSASPKESLPPLADPPYALTAGEQNDLLSSMVRGVDGFASYFTHHVFSKDPIGGVVFLLGYAWGGAALMLPAFSKIAFGEAYVKWFTEFAQTMAATPFAGTIAAASSQAQILFSTGNLLVHGPNSDVMKSIKSVLKDPITISAAFWLAYGVGYLLANGINGHDIPGLSESLREEAGTAPETTYPFTGAKIMVTLYEILHSPDPVLHKNIKKELQHLESAHPKVKQQLERIQFIYWLHTHAVSLPKLAREKQFSIEQQIEAYFNNEDARALKTLLYPEKQRSIAAQIFYIPLSYIPAILRVGLAMCMSIVAFISGFPHPWSAIQRAGENLTRKIAYDLNRLVIFTTELLRLIVKCTASVFKAFAYTINLIVGRIGGFCRSHVGHYFHQGFASLHRGLAWLREYLYPATITASVVTGHPLSTLDKFTESYHKLRFNLRKDTTQTEACLLVPPLVPSAKPHALSVPNNGDVTSTESHYGFPV